MMVRAATLLSLLASAAAGGPAGTYCCTGTSNMAAGYGCPHLQTVQMSMKRRMKNSRSFYE
jgi:hypothetical protein